MSDFTTGRLHVTITDEGATRQVLLEGQIDDSSELVALCGQLDGSVIIDLEHVSFINSIGVREWIRMLRSLKQRNLSVRLRRCSEAMIHQINMIEEASGDAVVESFFAPFMCDNCGYEGSRCLDVETHEEEFRQMNMPELECPECKGAMEFNEIPERYLLFLDA